MCPGGGYRGGKGYSGGYGGGPQAKDIPPHVLFAYDHLCAQRMGTEKVEATV